MKQLKTKKQNKNKGPELDAQKPCKKLHMVAQTCNPRAGKVETRGSLQLAGSQGNLVSKLQANERPYERRWMMFLKITSMTVLQVHAHTHIIIIIK